MVYVTGDLHGDISRFKARAIKKLRRRDTLIVCGDFGFIWDGSQKEKRVLKWLGKRKYNVVFVEGVHDNLSLIYEYPETQWMGGKTRVISGRLRQLCRGSVFDIDDTKIFAFGGGDSINTQESDFFSEWWDKQMPTNQELDEARRNLLDEGNKVDYIVTHQSSRKLKQLMTMEDNEASVLDVFLDEVREICEYKGWFFGSYHQDRIIPPAEMAIFEAVIPLKKDFNTSVENLKKRSRK